MQPPPSSLSCSPSPLLPQVSFSCFCTRSVLLIQKLLFIKIGIRRKISYARPAVWPTGRSTGHVYFRKETIDLGLSVFNTSTTQKQAFLGGNRAKIYKSAPFEKRVFPFFALSPVEKYVLYTRCQAVATPAYAPKMSVEK